MNKEKICRGTGKAKGHGCGKMSKFRSYGLCHEYNCWTNWLLNTELGQETIEIRTLRGKKKYEREAKRKKRKQKENDTDWSKKLQTKINEIVRLIDKGLPCLAKGHHANQIHAGHIYSRGSNPTIKYNLHNIHRQGAHSNHYQNDDGLLREGLKNEYGEDYLEFVSTLRKTPALKYTNLEYRDFYKEASKIALDLKKRGIRFDKEDRIKVRNQVNDALGIYDQIYCVY